MQALLSFIHFFLSFFFSLFTKSEKSQREKIDKETFQIEFYKFSAYLDPSYQTYHYSNTTILIPNV